MKKLFLPTTFFLVITLVLTTSNIFAQGNSETAKSAREETREKAKIKIEERLNEVKSKQASRSALKQEKLESAKLRVCENKKAAIVRRSTRLAERAERQITNFELKASRVEDFYNNKLLPKGLTVINYEDLIVDIEAKKLAAVEAVATAKTSASSFDCEADDPKGQLTNFRTDMKNVINSLKDYRTSIKNLIVGVRTTAKTATVSADN
jgi:hypothetical protein